MNAVALLPLAITDEHHPARGRPRHALETAGRALACSGSRVFCVALLLSMNVVMPLSLPALCVAFDLPCEVKVALVALAISPVPPLLPNKEARRPGTCVLRDRLARLRRRCFRSSRCRSLCLGSPAHSIAAGAYRTADGRQDRAEHRSGCRWRPASPCSHWLPALAAKLARPVSIFGLGLLVVSALPLLFCGLAGGASAVRQRHCAVFAVMAMIGLAVGHALGGPDPGTRTVLALSTASRHPAVALAVALRSGVPTRMQALAAVLLLCDRRDR